MTAISSMVTLAGGRGIITVGPMLRPALGFLLALLVTTGALRATEPVTVPEAVPEAAAARKQVVVIPVRDQIAQPVLYIIRRGLKEAIAQKADLVILDMKTPGGEAGVTIEIMEAMERFPGEIVTFVNTEAGSAGAIIAMITDHIYFAPTGVMGAAELILGTGADAPEALKRKMTSYIAAKAEALSASPSNRRAEVLKAMMNSDFELKIGDEVISPKGELLTLTAARATALYGDPAQPLLAAGIAKDVEELLTNKFGTDGYTIKTLEVTWSERLAVWLNAISPVLMGLGLLALFIEFKTPGFGIFGVAGGLLLAVVFLGNFVAGFSGHEPMLLFAVGLIFVAVEIFFFPGIAVMAVSGLALMLGALVWSMADLWPNEPFTFSGDVLVRPLTNVGLGVVLAVALGLALLRFMPRGLLWDKLVLREAVAGSVLDAPSARGVVDSLVGCRGVAATALLPSGQVEIDGRRHEAKVEIGTIPAGATVVVVQRTPFGLVVKEERA
jgi:membrane-bound serine protease (ClpP class)